MDTIGSRLPSTGSSTESDLKVASCIRQCLGEAEEGEEEKEERGISSLDFRWICESLSNREVTIETVVKHLGPHLTSSNVKTRSRSLEMLSRILSNLPLNCLSSVETKHLIDFLCNRFKDHHSLIPHILRSLLHLCKNKDAFEEGMAAQIFVVLSRDLVTQQQPVDDRFIVYQIIGKLMNNQLEDLKPLKNDFVYGFVQLVEGERDPRCLILVFKLFCLLVDNFALGHLEEDVFDIISAYFPLSYNQPSDDTFNITRGELAESLQKCLQSAPCFAPYALPLLIEKMESELESSKIDCYKALRCCAPVYGCKHLEPFLSSLWTCIRVDTLTVRSFEADSTAAFALEALAAVVFTLQPKEDMLSAFLGEIMKDLEPALVKQELQLMKAATQILLKAASCSQSFSYIVDKVFPLLLGQFTFESASNRKAVLETFSGFFTQGNKLETDQVLPQIPHKESFLTITVSAASDPDAATDLRLTALDSIQAMIISPFGLTEDQFALIYKMLLVLITSPILDTELRVKTRTILVAINAKSPDVSKKEILPILFRSLECGPQGFEEPTDSLENIMHALTDFHDIEVRQKYAVQLTRIIAENYRRKSTSNAKVTKRASSCLAQIVNDPNSLMSGFLFEMCLWPLLVEYIHCHICHPMDLKDNCSQVNAKYLLSVTSFVSRHLNDDDAGKLTNALTDSFLFNTPTKFLPSTVPACDCKGLSEIVFSEMPVESMFVEIFHSVICNLHPKQLTPNCVKVVSELLDSLSLDDVSWTSVCQIISSIVNKLTDDKEQERDSLLELVQKHLDSEPAKADRKEREKAINLISWVTKALVMRCHPRQQEMVSRLMNVMRSEEREEALLAAKGLLVTHQRVDCLSIDSHCRIMPFYPQKFFLETLPSLLEGVNNHNALSWRRQVFRYAILGQLQFLPQAVIKTQVNKIHSVITASLKDRDHLENQGIAVMCILHLLSDKNVSFLTNDVDSVITELLSLLQASGQMQVKRDALRCLTLISSSFSEHLLLPQRNKVVSGLKPSLDDRKRLVRYAAAEARLRWVLLGQPGGRN